MEITKNPLEEVIGEISEELAKQIKRQAGKFRDNYVQKKTLLWQKSAPLD